MTDRAAERWRMVDEQIRARGIRHPGVLRAMRRVPREVFVPPAEAGRAFEDTALPIAEAQTISQPYVVALMMEALEPEPADRILEIGTGSGYSAAVLAEIVAEVISVERLPGLARAATERLAALGYRHVRVVRDDGSGGWPAGAPYDGIVVMAGGPAVPEALLRQLPVGAHLVIPVGSTPRAQEVLRVTRRGPADYEHRTLGDVAFVPLLGEAAWPEAGASPPDRLGAAGRSFSHGPRPTVARVGAGQLP